jgi:hypothetical protein
MPHLYRTFPVGNTPTQRTTEADTDSENDLTDDEFDRRFDEWLASCRTRAIARRMLRAAAKTTRAYRLRGVA